MLEVLANNWYWFLLGGLLVSCVAIPFALRAFKGGIKDMPATMGIMLSGFDSVDEESSVEEVTEKAFIGFASGAISFFGSFFRRGAPMMVISIISSILFLLGGVGLIIWIVRIAIGAG